MSLVFKRESSPEVVGILSTKIKGSPPFNEVSPRILNEGAELAAPLEIVIFKFGITPCNPCPALIIGLSSKASEEIASTAPDRFTFFCVPYPTTTTSSNRELSSCSLIVCNPAAALTTIVL